MITQEYVYNAFVEAVYDGDTITVDIDLGFGVWLRDQKLRLYGINTPELRGVNKEAGAISRDWLREKILGKEVVLQTMKDKKEKYGRWLANVYIGELFINDQMIAEGLAIKYQE